MPKRLDGNKIEIQYDPPDVTAYLIDDTALEHSLKPMQSKTYGEYCNNELNRKILKKALYASRVDIVFDVYVKETRKRQTRISRGKKGSVRIAISKDTPIFKKTEQVMSVGENKTELFSLIADSVKDNFNNDNCTVVVTKNESVVSNKEIDTSRITPCLKEEADDRMFLHVFELSKLGHKKVTVATVDTAVVALALYAL